MFDDTALSPIRRVLCSHANAVRVACWMRREGLVAAVVTTGNPLQPWLVVDATATSEDSRACA